jgi:hypothetical protein
MSAVFRAAVAGSWFLLSTALVAAWIWGARTRCVELGTPFGAKVALVASLVAGGASLVALMARPDEEGLAWQVAAGAALLGSVAAFFVAGHVQPHGPCG